MRTELNLQGGEIKRPPDAQVKWQDLLSRKLIGVGRCRDGLYYLENHSNERAAMVVSPRPEVCHQRVGHASDERLRHIHFMENYKLPISLCDSCIWAKQTRSFS